MPSELQEECSPSPGAALPQEMTVPSPGSPAAPSPSLEQRLGQSSGQGSEGHPALGTSRVWSSTGALQLLLLRVQTRSAMLRFAMSPQRFLSLFQSKSGNPEIQLHLTVAAARRKCSLIDFHLHAGLNRLETDREGTQWKGQRRHHRVQQRTKKFSRGKKSKKLGNAGFICHSIPSAVEYSSHQSAGR